MVLAVQLVLIAQLDLVVLRVLTAQLVLCFRIDQEDRAVLDILDILEDLLVQVVIQVDQFLLVDQIVQMDLEILIDLLAQQDQGVHLVLVALTGHWVQLGLLVLIVLLVQYHPVDLVVQDFQHFQPDLMGLEHPEIREALGILTVRFALVIPVVRDFLNFLAVLVVPKNRCHLLSRFHLVILVFQDFRKVLEVQLDYSLDQSVLLNRCLRLVPVYPLVLGIQLDLTALADQCYLMVQLLQDFLEPLDNPEVQFDQYFLLNPLDLLLQ